MRMVDLIIKKRNGELLTEEEIDFIIDGYVKGKIPDYQISAWLMAIYFKGMNFEETGRLTKKMMYSGEVFDLSDIDGPKIDKHSTGGVGDKVSIPLAPLVASCDVYVPMVSGRGLGHTGGTLDKLESIPGFRTNLSYEEFKKVLKKNKMAMIGQTENFVPADKKLYALRDVTGTVESIPLITASIMSKKLASGAEGFVMDVKTGTGAFMQTIEDAENLAKFLVETGKVMNKKIKAFITDMNEPLGLYVGNSLEILESIEFLKGKQEKRLKEVIYLLASNMLILAGKVKNENEARRILDEKISSGKALETFVKMVELQGGDPRVTENYDLLPKSKYKKVFLSDKNGYIYHINTRLVGIAAGILGAGRKTYDDVIDPAVGFKIIKKYGNKVEKGEPIVEIYYNDENKLSECIEILKKAYTIREEKPSEKPILYKVIE